MKLTFRIEYRTAWGEELGVILDGNNSEPIILRTPNGEHWEGEAEMPDLPACVPVSYRYGVYRDGQCIRRESGTMAHLFCPGKKKNCHYILNDFWKDLPAESYLYSSAFSGDYQSETTIKVTASADGSITFRALCPCLHHKRQVLAISGDCPALGNWDIQKTVLMEEIQPNEWTITLNVSTLEFPLSYKFVACNADSKQVEEWENHDNRMLNNPELKKGEIYLTPETEVHFTSSARKVAGTAIPVFSLRSEKSFGVGDFGDLKKLIDWAAKTHQQAVQILPINDTTITHTWMDSYPYNSISIYAFHPMYADLKQMGNLKDKETAAAFNRKQKELNALSAIDYEAVNRVKWEYFHQIFKQEGEKVLASKAFRSFFEANKDWLQPYAAFSYLRDLYHTPNFREWPQYSEYNAQEIEELCRPDTADYAHIAIYFYIQFNLHLQLLEATTYAREHGVVLKGDIPIGISRNSVEAWTEPYYFNLNGQAGAPPDDFSINGQNWGFPTYNWDVMENDGYKWWMKRFQKMAEYFDAYRIDHILGFFRIWEIPMNAVHGLLGQFVPALPMSREEIESYGLSFREEFLRPYIHEYFLGQVFGPHTDYVKQTFIEPTETYEVYRMRPEFDTQRKVEAFFAGKNDEDSIWVRDGLYALISDVLFVPDRKDPNLYHPRIGVQHDFIYRALNDWEKTAFNRLYDQYYYHRHNDFWQQQAMKKLPQLTQSTRMLVCGEDLGMIPDCVAWVMNDLRILSLEIQRMPKNPAEEFGRLNEYPYRSVCTFSTHDMSTLRGWWEEDYQQTQRYYNQMLGHYGTAPAIATPELCEEIVRNHLYSNSILCILSLQDWLSMDGKWRNPNVQEERINIPANPRHYWRYRMHLTLEQLMKAESLNEKIRELVKQTGRNPEK